MFDTWKWGPGKNSILALTHGLGASGQPWREVQVFYWHPERKQIRLLGLSPFARGVSEGTIKFEGESADGVFDLYQTGGLRKMGLRWAFDGSDKYHATLLEATGPEGLKPMNEWDYIRSKTLSVAPPRIAEGTPKPSDRLKALEALLGRTWEAKGETAGGHPFHTQTTFEWIPYASGIYARVMSPTKGREPAHLLDAYFYQHTGTGALRCLALSSLGGVHEGDVTVLLDGSALKIDLKGFEGDRSVANVVRLDFEKDGTLRHRVWSVEGDGRKLMFDVHHNQIEPR